MSTYVARRPPSAAFGTLHRAATLPAFFIMAPDMLVAPFAHCTATLYDKPRPVGARRGIVSCLLLCRLSNGFVIINVKPRLEPD